MDEETGTSIRSWEEEIYWRNFQCINFFQFLISGFDRKLAIPEKFTRKLGRKLPEVVSLRGPSGATWKVGLTTNDNKMFFSDGWTEFVKDHLLEENDYLVFKYDGDSYFDVLIFDGQSMCEKAASYFVKKHGHGGHERGYCVKETTDKPLDDVTVASDNDIVGSLQKRNACNDDDIMQVRTPKKARVASHRRWQFNSFRHLPNARSDEPPSGLKEFHVKPDVGQMSHNKRPMRGALLKRSQQLAQEAVSNDGFFIVMQPSHVTTRYYVTLPVGWTKKHISLEKQDVILRFEGKTWNIKYLSNKIKESHYRGSFSCGWKKFAIDNKLHISDACVFEPGTKVNNMVVLDVQIFRA